jgi:flagellar basal-body rod protein FlgF
MINASYVGISAQLALQRRLDSIANNVANASTAGFRGEQIRFTTAASTDAQPNTAFAAIGETYLVRTTGDVVRTDNPFDVAIDGDGWLAVSTPLGTAYSRDGRMQMSQTGELLTLTGHPVLDTGGSPIRLDPTAGSPSIARDGTITQGSRRLGTIGLFAIDQSVRLDRGVDATVISPVPAQPVVDQSNVGVRQGFMERSNVNPITEMSKLILDQRMFEAVTGALNETEQTKQDAIRSLAT